MSTDYHARWHAQQLRLQRAHEGVDGLARSVGEARVDLNPHQIDAAIFALKAPVARGVMLADEVGLGKTIEAGITIAQCWAERRRRVLLIVPAALRTQWRTELSEKFSLRARVLDRRAADALKRAGHESPFDARDAVVVASYEFVAARADEVRAVAWDMVVIDEAHRLRNAWRKDAKSTRRVVEAVQSVGRKVLLTATPLQNSLMELYGLVSILDDKVFLDERTFRERFVNTADPERRDEELRSRLRPFVRRTLRSQVQEYVPYTRREALTFTFSPTLPERSLYEAVSAYLQRDQLAALPAGQRALVAMVLRKLLASSTAAIGATLSKMARRLAAGEPVEGDLEEDYETLDVTREEWEDDAVLAERAERELAVSERAELEGFAEMAREITRDAKATRLLETLGEALSRAQALGASRKAVIFTESRETQRSLVALLSAHGFEGRIALMNGSNDDEGSRQIYARWRQRHASEPDIVTGSRAVDIKAAIVEEFRDRAELLIATESAAEGINLQFCALVVNYDLPWNPQRVEQRIGRCHRYGQRHDVVVVNFVDQSNEADRRVFELLSEKFKLFSGVFGASDEVLGALASGVDVERRIGEIYQRCRTNDEIRLAFDALQSALGPEINARMETTRRSIVEHLDVDVHQRLKVCRAQAEEMISERERRLLGIARHLLGAAARFDDGGARFEHEGCWYNAAWHDAQQRGDTFLRAEEGLGGTLVERALTLGASPASLRFRWTVAASALAPVRGRSGWLEVALFRAEGVGRQEEALMVSAVDDTGQALDPEVAETFFRLDAELVGAPDTALPEAAIGAVREGQRRAHHQRLADRDLVFINEEEEKLSRRVDDLATLRDREIRDVTKQIAELRRQSKAVRSLAEKKSIMEAIRRAEADRSDRQRRFHEETLAAEQERERLMQQVEVALEVTPTTARLFALRWALT
jgi:adenine-specific DNA-methyltransferase